MIASSMKYTLYYWCQNKPPLDSENKLFLKEKNIKNTWAPYISLWTFWSYASARSTSNRPLFSWNRLTETSEFEISKYLRFEAIIKISRLNKFFLNAAASVACTPPLQLGGWASEMFILLGVWGVCVGGGGGGGGNFEVKIKIA